MPETFTMRIPCETKIKRLIRDLSAKGFALDFISWEGALTPRVDNVVVHYHKEDTHNDASPHQDQVDRRIGKR